MSLNDLLDYGRTHELTETRIIDLEQSDKAVNKLRHTTGTKRHFNSNTRDNHRRPNAVPKPTQGHKKHNDKKETEGKPRKSNSTCRNYAKKCPHEGGMLKCSAQGSECYNCGKFNDFAKYCMSKPRQENDRLIDRLIENPLDALVYANLAMIVTVTKMFLRSVFTALETTTTSTQCSKLELMTHG